MKRRIALAVLLWIPAAVAQPRILITSPAAAQSAETALQERPDDVDSRSALIGYYSRSRENTAESQRASHILWLAGHHPDAAILGQPEGTIDRVVFGGDGLYQTGESFTNLMAIWRKQASKADATAAVLGNAGHFFRLVEPEFAAGLLQRAIRLDPKEERYAVTLGALYGTTVLGVIAELHEVSAIEIDSRVAHSPFAQKAMAALRQSQDASVLRGAGRKLSISAGFALSQEQLDFDPRGLAEQLLLRARELAPKDEPTLRELGLYYRSQAQLAENPEVRVQLSRKAMETMQAQEAVTSNPFLRQSLRGDISYMAYQAHDTNIANEYARQLLGQPVPQPQKGREDSDAIHRANTVLGLLAADRGELDAAAEFLIKSGQVQGSPSLNSYGPSMLLASVLLQKGKPDAVLEYLRLCGLFWTSGKARLDQWTAAVKGGRMPQFSYNLSR